MHKKNTSFSWLVFEKVTRALSYLLMSILLARYYAPTEFAAFTKLILIQSLILPIANGGIVPLILRDFSVARNSKPLLAAAIYIRVLYCIIISITLMATSLIFDVQSLIISILVFITILQIFDPIEIFLHAKRLPKRAAKIRVISLNFGMFLKLIPIYFGLSIEYVLVLFVADWIVSAVIFAKLFKRINPMRFGNFGQAYVDVNKKIVEGFPILLNGFFTTLYMKFDLFILGTKLTEQSFGLYASSTIFLPATYMLAQILNTLFAPKIYRQLQANKGSSSFISFFRLQLILGVLLALIYYFLLPLGARVLMSEEVADVALTTRYLSLVILFTYLGVGTSVLVNYLRLNRYYLIISLIGFLFNLLLLSILSDISIVSVVTVTILGSFIVNILLPFLMLKELRILFLELWYK